MFRWSFRGRLEMGCSTVLRGTSTVFGIRSAISRGIVPRYRGGTSAAIKGSFRGLQGSVPRSPGVIPRCLGSRPALLGAVPPFSCGRSTVFEMSFRVDQWGCSTVSMGRSAVTRGLFHGFQGVVPPFLGVVSQTIGGRSAILMGSFRQAQ